MPNTYVSSECSRRVEPCNSRPNAGCECWPPLTLRLRFDSASLSCRIMLITTCKFIMAAGTNACWQAALVPVECCSIAPQIHSIASCRRAARPRRAAATARRSLTKPPPPATSPRTRSAVAGTTAKRDHRHRESRKSRNPERRIVNLLGTTTVPGQPPRLQKRAVERHI